MTTYSFDPLHSRPPFLGAGRGNDPLTQNCFTLGGLLLRYPEVSTEPYPLTLGHSSSDLTILP